MPLKPMKDLAIRSPRDLARTKNLADLRAIWDQVDSDIADALGEPLPSHPSTSPTQEA